jgi:hypothetical protein
MHGNFILPAAQVAMVLAVVIAGAVFCRVRAKGPDLMPPERAPMKQPVGGRD